MNSGPASWTRIYRRVIAMDRAEIGDRIRQQVVAWFDFLRYKAGADFAPRMQTPIPGAPPRFFFSPDAVPNLCSRMRQQFPGEAKLILERAARICQHRFDLLGYEGVDYGSEIDWHCDRIHGKRAPRKPWFRVKYLDFAEVGDSKVTWELNRHQHLVTLAKAFWLSGDHNFAEELFRQWDHWHQENPYPVGINWASSLEVAFRSLSWLWVYFILSDSPVLPANFRAKWLHSLAVSGRHIETYLSTYFSPNTHLLGEAVALFFIGTLCPEIPAARRWQQRGWQIVKEEAKRQVRSDGLHFEQSTYYHVYALDFFLHSAVLASVNHIAVPPEFDRTLERMLQALAILVRGGAVPRLGDDDGGRLFDPSRNQAVHLLDPLSTGAVLFGRGDFKALSGGPREETMWLLGESGLDEFDRIAPTSPARDSIAFPASGLYVMSGGDHERQLVIDAGPQGEDTAGHGHADALSIIASSGGRSLLIDSGTFQYVGRDSERDRFRGTSAHNTLMIAGRDQAQPRGPFGWERLPHVRAEAWIAGKTFDLFVGSHDGYSQLPNRAIHRRFVFSLHSGFWFVRDVVLGFGEYQLDLFWHLAPELHHDIHRDYFSSDSSGLQIITADGHAWKRSIEEHPDSPVYGRQGSHSALHFATRVQLLAEFVTVLQPLTNSELSERKLTIIPLSIPSPVVGYRYQSGDTEHCMFFGQGEAWKLDGWGSDAEFLYSTVSASRRLLISCNATHVEWEGRSIMKASRPVLRCEIIGNEQPEVVSTDSEAVTVDREAWKILSTFNSQVAVKIT